MDKPVPSPGRRLYFKMKINYKNTCLDFLNHQERMRFYLPETNKNMTEAEQLDFGTSIKNAFKDLAGKEGGFFKQKVQLLTKPFLQAWDKGKHKLVDVFDKEEMEETGVFLTQLDSYTNTYFYYLKTYFIDGQWTVDWCLLIFTKHTHAEMPGLDLCIFETREIRKTFIYKEWDDAGKTAEWWMAWLVTLPIFLKYCTLETKVVNAGRKGHHVGEKYINDTEYPIEILDSTWFTTIIRSEGFGVEGHFRMQPYGPGLTLRKLIWIAPFEKEGYTRTAKILSSHQ
jgi:hypothetical protein